VGSHAMCEVHSKMQSMSLLGGLGACPPRKFLKMHTLRLNLVLSEAQNCYAKDSLWKSAVREISLAVHANLSLRLSWELGFQAV